VQICAVLPIYTPLCDEVLYLKVSRLGCCETFAIYSAKNTGTIKSGGDYSLFEVLLIYLLFCDGEQ
jgi:hypothetical protein